MNIRVDSFLLDDVDWTLTRRSVLEAAIIGQGHVTGNLRGP